MTPETRQILKSNLEAVEGRINHMYLDTANPPNVSCGVGHKVASVEDALKIPFAPAWKIPNDFRIVSAAPKGHVASAYVGYCETRLSDEAIDALLDSDIDEKLGEIRARWPQFDTWLDAVQLAIADMVFNLGLGGVEHKFPKFTAAVDSEDWATAAEECNRPQLSVERNMQTKAWFLQGAVRV